MGRGATTQDDLLASAYLTLRRAPRDDPDELAKDVERAREQIAEALQDSTTSKADAASRLGVSPQTLKAWVARGLVPTVKVRGYTRERVPMRPLLALAAEVAELREAGRKRGLLVEALARLEAEDDGWREEIAPLLERARQPFDRSQYVSAARPDWHPDD